MLSLWVRFQNWMAGLRDEKGQWNINNNWLLTVLIILAIVIAAFVIMFYFLDIGVEDDSGEGPPATILRLVA